MEAIRLTGQGFRVEVNNACSGIPASALRRHDHHLMWCGNGISAAMRDHFRLSLERGEAIMLTGAYRRLVSNADALTAVA